MLTVEKIDEIRSKKQDMKDAYQNVEKAVFEPKYALALDYIFHNNNEQNYDEQLRKNELRVKLKNAIMQTWSDVKK